MIGAGEWGNVPRVFDAVRLGLQHGRDRVDIFSSSVVHVDTGPWNDHHLAGDNLHGIYGSLGSVLPLAKLESYLLRRTSPSFPGQGGVSSALHSWTYGVRAVDEGTGRWGYEAEIIGQRGRTGRADLASWAFTAQAQRRWRERPWKPVAVAEINFASGDRNPNDARVQTFDQLYPTNHGIYGIVDQIGRRNTKNTRLGVWFEPHRRLTVRAEGHSFWLASRYDALYGAGGAAVIPGVPGGAASTDIGRECDISASWKPSTHYEIGAQVGHLFPRTFLRRYSPGFHPEFYTLYLAVGI